MKNKSIINIINVYIILIIILLFGIILTTISEIKINKESNYSVKANNEVNYDR